MNIDDLRYLPSWEWPEDAGQIILKTLRDGRAVESDRLLALELAGDFTIISDELMEGLLSIVCNGDESDELRGRAVISMGPALECFDMDVFDDSDDESISEGLFNKIQETLHRLYMDAGIPKLVRRRILEAAVRAPRDWHTDAIRAGYASGDEDWKLTAVFCMQFVRGFEDQIFESLNSENEDIHYQAVYAAGNWQVDRAWPHIADLLVSEDADKDLVLAAIDAAVNIRPKEAADLIHDLINADDEDIVEAAYEAMAMVGVFLEDDMDDDFDDDDLPF